MHIIIVVFCGGRRHLWIMYTAIIRYYKKSHVSNRIYYNHSLLLTIYMSNELPSDTRNKKKYMKSIILSFILHRYFCYIVVMVNICFLR